jgi:hypothetical protein
MNLLIFLISIIFYLVFYFFYIVNNNKNIFNYTFSSWDIYFSSLSWSLIIEAIGFVILWIVFFIYFSDFSLKRKIYLWNKNIKIKENNDNLSKKYFLDRKKITSFLSIFFKEYLYYIWFISFYLSIFIIFKSFDISNFSYVIMFINILVLIAFFLTGKFFIFRDFIKINTIIFSIYYVFIYLFYFATQNLWFFAIDIMNSIFILILFLLTFYDNKNGINKKEIDKPLLFYFFLYIFLFLSYIVWVFINKYSFPINIYLIIFYSSLVLNIFMYFYLSKIKLFKKNKIFIRVISFLFWYVSSIFAMMYLIEYWLNFKILFFLVYLIIFNFFIHNKFENYISFLFSNLLITFIIYFWYLYMYYIEDDGLIFIILSIFMSLETIIFTYFYKFKYDFDYYFLHIYSYFVNIISIVMYLILFKIDLFVLGIIFFIESIYIFLSYYRLKQIKNKINS